MSEHLHYVRQKIHKLGITYPEMASHFGLSHVGLIDTETEKLVEKFSFMLTESEARRKSIIVNKIKPFMEIIFPEWYRPDVSSCIAEFNNYGAIGAFNNLMKLEEPITFVSDCNGKPVYLSAKPGFQFLPLSIEKSYFTATETLTHMHFYFKNHANNEEFTKNNKIKIYLNSKNHEEIFSLIHYIFDPKFKDKKFLLKMPNQEIELNRESISLPLFDIKNIKQNVFFESKNKLSIFMEILNRLNHHFYIDIDLGSYSFLKCSEFSIHIHLDEKAYSEFSNLKNFAKTNCIPVFDIYEKQLNDISLSEINDETEITIANLKDDNLIELIDNKLHNFEKKETYELPDEMYVQSEIQFIPVIPYDIEHNLVFKKSYIKPDALFHSKGLYTQFIKNTTHFEGNSIKLSGSFNNEFGVILTQPSRSIFYNEILSNAKFFNFIYNRNYYIGKKMNNINMVIEYLEKISQLFFNYKESFFKYFSEIEVVKWKMVAKMSDAGKPLIISRYLIKNTENKSNYFYDRILEKILDNIAETDLVYEIVRV